MCSSCIPCSAVPCAYVTTATSIGFVYFLLLLLLHVQLYTSFSPALCLCDYCHRAFHTSCLDYGPVITPRVMFKEGEWACPK